ncbi:MAG: prolipoprotein diacylglyceryl transferase, partial [Mycobacteriaceae bacterium]|nr:prolipoprotein diacylglyceryl transferase [Mycobacteriaceae bacterium]
IITGIIVGLLITDRRWAARGGQRGVVYDIALWMVPFGLIGGRLYHLATDWQTYWGPGGAGLGAAVRIWDGGLGIWGAVALGVVGAWIGCRRNGIPLPAFVDAAAPGLVLAQAIGRLGNYFNQELYGRETTMPWGLEIFYRRDPAGYVDVHSLDGVSTGQVALVVQPTFLYELLWNLLVFGLLLLLDRRFTLGHGRLFASYVALYCVGRFGVELLRDDTATHIAGIRINIFTSTFVFIGAVVYIILAAKGREDPASLRGRRPDEAEEASEPEPDQELATVGAASVAAEAVGTAAAGGEAAPAGVAAAESEQESEAEVTDAQAAVAEAAEGGVGESDQADVVEEAETAESDDEEAVQLEGEPQDVAEVEAESAEADGVELEAADDGPVTEDVVGSEAEPEEAEAEPEDGDAVVDEAEAEESESDETEPEIMDAVEPEVTEPEPTAEAAPATATSGGEAEHEAAELEAADAEEAEEADETAADEDSGDPQSVGPESVDGESGAVEPEPEGEDDPTPPSPTPDTASESAATARQRWRFRLRRQRS